MKLFQEVNSVRHFIATNRPKHRIGLVPTMGALHRGHQALLQTSREANDLTVCSIFVNPTQFNNPEDLESYPRTLDEDLSLLEKMGCDAVFYPPSQEIYPAGVPQLLKFDFGYLNEILEGKHRPGHFSGVGLVVAKLLTITQPHRAYFGQKDLQQLAIIRQMVSELFIPVEIISVPIVRESSGLALSSRNQRLSSEEKQVAAQIYQSLLAAKQQHEDGIALNTIKEQAISRLGQARIIRPEYFEAVSVGDFRRLASTVDIAGPIAFCVAAYVGEVRLIDNIIVS